MAGIKTPSIAELASMALLNPQQRQLVENDLANLNRAIDGRPMGYSGGDNMASGYVPESRFPQGYAGHLPEPELALHARQRDLETLDKGTPPDYSGYTKNELFSMYKELTADYREGMLSHGQMWEPTHAHIQQFMAHEEAKGHIGHAILSIHRILDEEDEGFSLESLRPTDRVPINLPMFRKNFDEMRFTDQTERALRERELDDQTYVEFMRLKLQTSSAKLIQRRLGIDQTTYEACEDRLAREIAFNPIDDDELENGHAESEPTLPMEEVEPVVLEELARNGDAGTHIDNLAAMFGLTQKQMRHYMKQLKEQGKIKGIPGNQTLYRLNTDPVSA